MLSSLDSAIQWMILRSALSIDRRAESALAMIFLQIRRSLVLLSLFTVLGGVLYTAFITGMARIFFPRQAEGSMLMVNGRPVGSELIGQQFSGAGYFHGRPSATTPFPYNAAASGGSNLGPTNPAQTDSITMRVRSLRGSGAQDSTLIPIDLVTASGSGLDPHISPSAALLQIPRIAHARGLSPDVVRRLIGEHIELRQFGVLGEPRVCVLTLNIALDTMTRVEGAE